MRYETTNGSETNGYTTMNGNGTSYSVGHTYPTLETTTFQEFSGKQDPSVAIILGCYEKPELNHRISSAYEVIDQTKPDIVLLTGGYPVLIPENDGSLKMEEKERVESVYAADKIRSERPDLESKIIVDEKSLDSVGQALYVSYMQLMREEGKLGDIYIHTDDDHAKKFREIVKRIYGYTDGLITPNPISREDQIDSLDLDAYFTEQYGHIPSATSYQDIRFGLSKWSDTIELKHDFYNNPNINEVRARAFNGKDSPKLQYAPKGVTLDQVVPHWIRN